MAVNGRCTPVEFHTFMKESFDAEIRLPVHTHQTSAIVSKRGESSKIEAAVRAERLRTVDDAHADDTAVMPREYPLALPRAHPPHADAPVVRAAYQPIAIAREREDQPAVT